MLLLLHFRIPFLPSCLARIYSRAAAAASRSAKLCTAERSTRLWLRLHHGLRNCIRGLLYIWLTHVPLLLSGHATTGDYLCNGVDATVLVVRGGREA